MGQWNHSFEHKGSVSIKWILKPCFDLCINAGSTDTACEGLQSSSGVKSPSSSSGSSSSPSATSTTSNSPAASNSIDQAAARAGDDKEKQNRIIIGVSVSIGVVVLLGAGLTVFFCLNKRRKIKKLETDGMKQFQGAAGPVLLPREVL